MRETRTVRLQIDPALLAYMEYVEVARRGFDLNEYDLFAAGYRARADECDAGCGSQPEASDDA